MPIRFKKQSAGSVTTPGPNYVSFFVDSTTGLPRLKDESGGLTDFSGGGGGGGGASETVSSVATSTVTAAVNTLQRVNVSGGAVTINLPSGHSAGDRITVKLVSVATNTCTIDANGSETIDGDATLVLSTDYEWATLVSDGTNWMQVG